MQNLNWNMAVRSYLKEWGSREYTPLSNLIK